MKLTFLACFTFIISTIDAQDIKPYKGAEKIIVTVDTVNLFSRLNVALFQNEYIIEQKDENLKFIITKGKSLGKHSAKFMIRAIAKDNTIIFSGATTLSGNIFSGPIDEDYEKLKYGGMKGSILRDAWNEMEKIAKELGTIVKYE